MPNLNELYTKKARAENELTSAQKRVEVAQKQKRSHRIHVAVAAVTGGLLAGLIGFKFIPLLIVIILATGGYLAVLTNRSDHQLNYMAAMEDEIRATANVVSAKTEIDQELLKGM